MKIKYKGEVLEISDDTIKSWRDIQVQVQVLKIRINTKKKKAIKSILNNRDFINKYINKSDEELLDGYEALDKVKINYDRGGMFRSKIPFKTN